MIGQYKPQDATTNPTLILAASQKKEYASLVDKAIAYARNKNGSIEEQANIALDMLLVAFGKEILDIIPGRVSTEVDAHVSFDTKASIKKALCLVEVSDSLLGQLEYGFAVLTRHRQALRGAGCVEGQGAHQTRLDLGGHQGR